MELCSKSSLDETDFNRFSELVDQVSKINYSDMEGRNSLMLLCLNNRKEHQLLECLKKLFERRDLDVKVKDGNGDSALILLCRNGRNCLDLDRVIRLLLENGLEINAKDKNGDNILFILCSNNQLPTGVNLKVIVKLCIEFGIDLSVNDVRGDNILFVLIATYNRKDFVDLVQLLVDTKGKDKGINLGLMNSAKGYNAVQLLKSQNPKMLPVETKQKVIDLLKKNGVPDLACW